MTDEEIGKQQEDSDIGFALEQVFPYLDPITLGAAWQAGRGDIARLAGSFAYEYGKTPGERNALQHALWQALLAYRFGSEVAKAIGDQHEKWQPYGNDNRKRDSKADLHNNDVGRQIGKARRERSEKNGGSRFSVPVNAIKQAVIDAFFAGRLDLSGGVGGRGVGLCEGMGKIHTLKPPAQVTANPPRPPLPSFSVAPWYEKGK